METYGYLDFTLANGEIQLAVNVHAFESIFAAVAALHQKHYREPSWIGDKKHKSREKKCSLAIETGATEYFRNFCAIRTFSENLLDDHGMLVDLKDLSRVVCHEVRRALLLILIFKF